MSDRATSGWTESPGADGRRFLRCDALATLGFAHGFTTRHGGHDIQGPAEVALSVADAGLPAGPIGMSRQVHGVRVSTPGDRAADADACWSPAGGGAVAVRVADCLPVLLAGPRGVVAAHAGWRGLLAGVLKASVEALGGGDGVRAAAIGPAIGRGAFEVGPEVAEAFQHAGLGGCVAAAAGDRSHAHLAGAAAVLLRRAGVPAACVHDADRCTFSEPATFFSYRRDGPGRGHQGSWVLPPGGKL